MRKPCYTHLSIEERETLSLGLAQGYSLRTMARVLGRAPSTVSREYARNARGHPYRACTAQRLAAARARPTPAGASTAGPVVVAVCPNPPGPGVFARADGGPPPSRVS
jgi:IS30 family transposase